MNDFQQEIRQSFRAFGKLAPQRISAHQLVHEFYAGLLAAGVRAWREEVLEHSDLLDVVCQPCGAHLVGKDP